LLIEDGREARIPEGVRVIIADYRDESAMLSSLEGMHFDAVIDFIML
jgi:hypothetical protein